MKRKLTSYTYVLDHTTQTPACRNSPRSNYCNCNTCQFLSKYFWLVIAAALLMEPVCLGTLESYIQTLSIWETHAYVGESSFAGVLSFHLGLAQNQCQIFIYLISFSGVMRQERAITFQQVNLRKYICHMESAITCDSYH